MTTTAPQIGSSADGVSWNLGDLYTGPDDPQIEHDISAAEVRAKAFETAWRGRINPPGGPAPEALLAAVIELEALYELMDKPGWYAGLLHAGKTDVPRHGALLARTGEQRTAINKHLIFFELEWCAVPDEAAAKLLASPTLAKYRYWLQSARIWKPYQLSEAEEKILEEKSVTGRAAFVRLFDETVPTVKVVFEHDGKSETTTITKVLAKLYDSDRTVRQAAAGALTVALRDNSRLLGYVLNTLVQDHKSTGGLRKYPTVMTPRNLANRIADPVVETLMASAEKRHADVARYYRLKAKLLGVDQLYDYDRYAPLFSDMPKMDWAAGKRTVQESYAAFSPKAGAVVNEFFDKRWVDAEPRDGKRGGAFSSGGLASVHPYILMSYTDRLRDVMTLAHELGHGLHQYLSRSVGYLQCDTPLTTAEMASVFGEMLTFRRLMEIHTEPRVRLGMLCSKIEDAFATVFRQVVLTRFEQSVHKARADEGELSTDRINELWMAANRPMHGDVVKLTDGYAWWWAYIGHFIHSPFYCYAYAFGELLVLALVQKYKQEGAAFVPNYLELLSSGGSDAPHVLLAKMGMDVNDPGFWDLGLSLLSEMIDEAEKLAAQLK